MARKRGIDRSQVIDTAAGVADREGLDAVTLARVASELDVRSPSLYAHVDGLSGLRRALSLEAAARLGDAMSDAMRGTDGVDALRALAEAYRTFARTRPGLYATLSSTPSPDDDEGFSAFAEPVGAIVAVLDGLGLAASDAVDLVRSLRSALHGFVTLEASGGFGLPGDIDRSFEVLVDVVISGILSRSADGPAPSRARAEPAPTRRATRATRAATGTRR
jgi:AcrR family transcriptional regulator